LYIVVRRIVDHNNWTWFQIRNELITVQVPTFYFLLR
jgi:hypothetical protein